MPSDNAAQMIQARREIQFELERLRTTADVLEDSSKAIGSIKSTYDLYSSSLGKATRTLKQLKNRIENDDRMIYYSFMFFLVVSGYIFLKRVRVIGLMKWLASMGWSSGQWVYDSATGDASQSLPVLTNTDSVHDVFLVNVTGESDMAGQAASYRDPLTEGVGADSSTSTDPALNLSFNGTPIASQNASMDEL